jgi:YVTN family beta-propeller protein
MKREEHNRRLREQALRTCFNRRGVLLPKRARTLPRIGIPPAHVAPTLSAASDSESGASRVVDTEPMARLAVSLGAAALLVLFLGCGGDSETAATPTSTATRPTHPEAAFEGVSFREIEPETTIAIGAPDVAGFVATERFLWAMSSEGLYRIDPETEEATLVFVPPSPGGALVADEATIWATSFEENVVRRIDAENGNVVATIKVGINPDRVAVTGDAVWVSNHRGGSVSRIDPATNRVVASVKVGPKGPAGPQSIEGGGGGVWVGVPNISAVVRIDPATNKIVKTIDVDIPGVVPCGDFAINESDVWLTNCQGISVLRIDARTSEPVALLSVGARAGSALWVGDNLWLSVEPRERLPGGDAPGGLVSIDDENRMVDAISLGHDFAGGDSVVAFDSLWVTDYAHGKIVRIPLDVLSP